MNGAAFAFAFVGGGGLVSAFEIDHALAAVLGSARQLRIIIPMKHLLPLSLALSTLSLASAAAASDEGTLRIICFGAHPDDCELQAGGVGAMWAAKGHRVKFVSVTNGDIGHWRDAGGPLARRRTDEVQRADQVLGVTSQVLDNHDGELEPTLENRRKMLVLISVL